MFNCHFLGTPSTFGALSLTHFSSPQRAVAAERRLAAQLGAPTPQIPDSAIVNAGYVEGGRSGDGWTIMFGQVE